MLKAARLNEKAINACEVQFTEHTARLDVKAVNACEVQCTEHTARRQRRVRAPATLREPHAISVLMQQAAIVAIGPFAFGS